MSFGEAVCDVTLREDRRRGAYLFGKIGGAHRPFSFTTSLKSVPTFVGISLRTARPASHHRSEQVAAASWPTPLTSLSARITRRCIFFRTGKYLRLFATLMAHAGRRASPLARVRCSAADSVVSIPSPIT